MDGDSRGGAALSVNEVSGKPIKFVGVGEKMDSLEPFYPERMAGRCGAVRAGAVPYMSRGSGLRWISDAGALCRQTDPRAKLVHALHARQLFA